MAEWCVVDLVWGGVESKPAPSKAEGAAPKCRSTGEIVRTWGNAAQCGDRVNPIIFRVNKIL
jgi:hypothetical protein